MQALYFEVDDWEDDRLKEMKFPIRSFDDSGGLAEDVAVGDVRIVDGGEHRLQLPLMASTMLF